MRHTHTLEMVRMGSNERWEGIGRMERYGEHGGPMKIVGIVRLGRAHPMNVQI